MIIKYKFIRRCVYISVLRLCGVFNVDPQVILVGEGKQCLLQGYLRVLSQSDTHVS